MIFNDDFLEFLECLNKREVNYILIGGYAVVINGYHRTTGDMDVFVERTEENAAKIVAAIADFGFGSLGFKKEDFLNPNMVIQIGNPPLRIDILSDIAGITFSEADKSKHNYTESNVTIPVIHINELIKNKEAAGRKKDEADAEALKKIRNKGNKK